MSETTKHDSPRPARRTIVKGAAWAVPAVTLAAPVAHAAGSPGEVIITGIGGCKLPGASCSGKAPWFATKGYLFLFNYTNTWDCPVVVTGGTVTLVSGTFPADGLTLQTGKVLQPGDGVVGISGESNSSANLTFTASIVVEYALDCDNNGAPDDATRYLSTGTTISVDGTAPCVDCDLPEPSDEAPAEETAVEEPVTTTTTSVEEPTTEEPTEGPASGADTEEATASP